MGRGMAPFLCFAGSAVLHTRQRPSLGEFPHSRLVFGPIMQNRRIEIRSVRPDQRMNLRVNRDRGEDCRITERSVDLPLKHCRQVDLSGAPVIEADPQSIIPERLH